MSCTLGGSVDAVSLKEMRAPGLAIVDGDYLSGLDRAWVTRKAVGVGAGVGVICW